MGSLLFPSHLRGATQISCRNFQRILWFVDGEYLSRAARGRDRTAPTLDRPSQANCALCFHRDSLWDHDRRSLQSIRQRGL